MTRPTVTLDAELYQTVLKEITALCQALEYIGKADVSYQIKKDILTPLLTAKYPTMIVYPQP